MFISTATGPPLVTATQAPFEAAINALTAYGGGDCPEPALAGLKMGLENSQPGSMVFVFTDASPKDPGLLGSILTLLQNTGSQV